MLLVVSSVFGQDIGTTKINVLEGFKPTVPEAFKLNENATFADTIKKDRTQLYKVIDVNLKSNYKTKPLAVAKVKDDKMFSCHIQNSYIKHAKAQSSLHIYAYYFVQYLHN